MRLTLWLWLVLIFAFSVGMCCAMAVRFCYFEAKPVVVQVSEQKTKILVAKRTIPSGVEITADYVTFQEVSLSEIPPKTLSSFAQVYRRRPAYPIPPDCPICEDLLVSQTETVQQATFVPTGSQFVALDIVHIRQGDKVFSPKTPLSTLLTTDQCLDVRIVPRQQAIHGKLAEKKNEVLRAFAVQDSRDNGELLLENVPIHQIQRKSVAGQADSTKNSLLLMLDTNEASKLTTAAKKGQIRILVHQESNNTALQPVEPENVAAVSDSSAQTLSVSIPFEPLPIDVPLIAEQTPPMPLESAPVVPMETVMETVQKATPTPMMADVFDPVLPSAPTPVPEFIPLFTQTNETSPNPDPQSDGHTVPVAPEVIVKEKISTIRNDAPVITFGPPTLRIISEQPAEQKPALARLSSTNEANEPVQEVLSRPYSGSVAEFPRISQSIQFLPPGKITPTKEYPQETMMKSTEIAATPPEIPLLIPIPMIATERGPGYSPFERRLYAAPLNENWNENLEDGLPTPPRLLKSSDIGIQTK